MSLKITTRKAGAVTVVDLVGRITLGAGSMALRECLLELSGADEHPGIVLNMNAVSNIDSSGIGELVSGFTTARTRGTVVKLAALPARIEGLLQMTGVSRILEIHGDEAGAVRSFE